MVGIGVGLYVRRTPSGRGEDVVGIEVGWLLGVREGCPDGMLVG
jgi:hypothetical protein